MTTLHTPGPWVVVHNVPNSNLGYRAIVVDNKPEFGQLICNPSPMGDANARLIAAAPAMLEALKIAETALEAYSGGESSDLAMIRAAIAKAEGKQSAEV